jgi:hypothetical protein
MAKTLNQIIFYSPPKSEYFFSNIGNQNIFFRKKPPPPPPPLFKLNGRSLTGIFSMTGQFGKNDTVLVYACLSSMVAA